MSLRRICGRHFFKSMSTRLRHVQEEEKKRKESKFVCLFVCLFVCFTEIFFLFSFFLWDEKGRKRKKERNKKGTGSHSHINRHKTEARVWVDMHGWFVSGHGDRALHHGEDTGGIGLQLLEPGGVVTIVGTSVVSLHGGGPRHGL